MKRDHLDNASELEALQAEIRRLKKQGQAEEDMNELQELFFSACALITFWLLGALIYHFMEGWSYGNSLYFNYVFLFTIGFGDYYPVTPVGQVVFIIWALMAVPIMSNFVVQTIQTLVGHATRVLALATSQKKAEQRDIEKEYYETHASYLHLAIENLEGDKDAEKDLNDEIDEETERDPTTITVQKSLLLDLLSTATFMEAQARRIMVENMDKGSNSRLLLQADYNIQLYSMDKLGEKEHIRWLKQFEESMQKTSDLQWVKDYRKTYAKLLVIGTKLMNLEGDKSLAFQRTSSKVPLSDDSDGSNASSSEKTAKVHTNTADDDKSR
jgi:potassium channel subfamily K